MMREILMLARSVRFICLLMLALGWSLPVVALDADGVTVELQDVAPININTADVDTLAASLNGVGLKKAQAIVAWRVSNGEFQSVEQLLEVKGVGDAILAKNMTTIRLE
jgi:competence protein ComEA